MMDLESLAPATSDQSPFRSDGSFDHHKAVDIVADLKASGDMDLADAMEALADFFRASENYIFDMTTALTFEQASAGAGNSGSPTASA